MSKKEYSLQTFRQEVGAYIAEEYEASILIDLTQDEKIITKNMLDAHYAAGDSINNAANYVVRYLKESRAWINDNINKNKH
jgi:hypothetical protein